MAKKEKCDHTKTDMVDGKKLVSTAWYELDLRTKWCELCGTLGQVLDHTRGMTFKEPKN